jgi:iron complex outermembrane receptor protein
MLFLNSVPQAPGLRSALAVACGVACVLADTAWAAEEVLAPVVITASRTPQALQTAPIGASVITAEQIERSGVSDANEAIRKLGGVAATSDLNNGRENSLDLRGFGATAAQNMVVLVDGIRISENEQANAHLASIPLELIERIEIVRGGASVLWGEGATAGVINVVLKRPQSGVSSAKLAAAVERFGGYEALASGQWAVGSVVLDASTKRVRSNGFRENSAYKQDVSALGVQWRDEAWHAGLRVVQEDQSSGLPGSLALSKFKADPRQTTSPNDYANNHETRFMGNLAYQTGSWAWQLDAGHRLRQPDYQYVSFGSAPVRGQSTQNQLTPRMTFADTMFGVDVKTVMGLDWQDWQFNKTGTDGLETGSQQNQAGYVHGDFSLPSLTRVSVGWRQERVRKVGDFPGNAGWFMAPAVYQRIDNLHAGELGVSQTVLPQWDVYARAASSYRLANIDENRQTPSQGALLPQQSSDREVGVKWAAGGNGATLRVFKQKTVNEIAYVADINANTNLDPTQRSGVELEGHWAVLQNLTLTGTWQQVSAQYRSGPNAGKEMTQVAPHSATARATYRINNQHTVEMGAQYLAASRYSGDESNQCAMHVPTSALLDGRYAWSDRVWTLAVTGTNLTDRKGYNYGTTYLCGQPSVYPYAGRNLKLSVSRVF